jgi:hypothetical protein
MILGQVTQVCTLTSSLHLWFLQPPSFDLATTQSEFYLLWRNKSEATITTILSCFAFQHNSSKNVRHQGAGVEDRLRRSCLGVADHEAAARNRSDN